MKHYNQTQVGASNAIAIILFIVTLCFIFFSCTPSNDRLTEVYIVNGDIEFTYKGDDIFIETRDEQDTYFFAVDGKEYSVKHFRDKCKWSPDSVYSCDNYLIFNDQLYLMEEGL